MGIAEKYVASDTTSSLVWLKLKLKGVKLDVTVNVTL